MLNHLHCEHIPLLSTKSFTSKEFTDSATLYMGLIQVRAEGLIPKLGTGSRQREVTFNDWWEEVILVPNKGYLFSRRKLVLEMANKDGGAHIDKKLSPEYGMIINGLGEFHRVDVNGNENIEIIDNMHLISIRQIAFEVLNSRYLIELIRNS